MTKIPKIDKTLNNNTLSTKPAQHRQPPKRKEQTKCNENKYVFYENIYSVQKVYATSQAYNNIYRYKVIRGGLERLGNLVNLGEGVAQIWLNLI